MNEALLGDFTEAGLHEGSLKIINEINTSLDEEGKMKDFMGGGQPKSLEMSRN